MNKHFYEPASVKINNLSYQIQKIEFEDETLFQVTHKSKIYCVVMLDEHNRWKPDIEMSEAVFTELMAWINKLYLQG